MKNRIHQRTFNTQVFISQHPISLRVSPTKALERFSRKTLRQRKKHTQWPRALQCVPSADHSNRSEIPNEILWRQFEMIFMSHKVYLK